MEFISNGMGVGYVFMVVVTVIAVDAVLGAIEGAKLDIGGFDIRKLPRFLSSGILPYVGGLGVLALATELIGGPFAGIFYPAAAAVVAKYATEIRDKAQNLYAIGSITHGDGIGEEVVLDDSAD